MTREYAKIWASIPRDKLAVLVPSLDKHFDALFAYANGAIIESKDSDAVKWFENEDPAFSAHRDYRVKPSADQPAEPWKPQLGYKFFFLTATGVVAEEVFAMCDPSARRVDFGNCFRTCEEAEAARERVRAALKGETISKKETVESLDGELLGDYEKELLRVFRKAKLYEYCTIEKVVKFESIKEFGIELLIPYDNGRNEFFNAISKFTKEAAK